MNRPYRLGLDIGTNSIGWAALTLDAGGQPDGVLDLGVRIFSDGRNPKDGTSLAVARRVPRGKRRRRDRYLRRRSDLMDALIAVGLMPDDETERQALTMLDPYKVRACAAMRAVSPHELGRAMFHLDQRRGFKSNRKTDGGGDNKLTTKVDRLRRSIADSGAVTLGEYLHRRRLKGKMVRARPEAGFYPVRQLYEDEFDVIRRVQEPAQTLRPEQWDHLRDIMFYQRPLKPVDPGWCLLEPGERRAPRALPCAQEFRMVQEANNLRIVTAGTTGRALTRDQRDRVLRELRTKKELKLDTLAKFLKLPSGARVNLLDENRKSLKGDETAACLSQKEAFGKLWHALSFERRTLIVRALIEMENPAEVEQKCVAEWGLGGNAARVVAAMPLPEGYARLSETAILRLLPLMEDAQRHYADAVAAVPEYRHHSDFRPDTALDRLPYYGAVLARYVVGADAKKPVEDEVGRYGRIANPTVHIGLNQLRRVVNRLIERYGKPHEIVVELARELKMNKEERDRQRRLIRDNEEANRKREQQIRSANGEPSPRLLRKLRLWEEQRYGAVHVCPYTLQPICFRQAISEETEIEHILPFSKTLDPSMANQVLAFRSANRIKGNRSPYEAFGTNPTIDGVSYDYARMLLAADGLPGNKRWRFLPDAMERFANEQEFLDRQLNETKYLSRIARVYLAHLYNERAEGRLRVRAIPGRLTALLRDKWGLRNLLRDHNRVGADDGGLARKNRDNHRHHALDAFVVAMTDQGLLKRISDLESDGERQRFLERLAPPWPDFSHGALRDRLDRMIISHRPDHGEPGRGGKTSGALHNDTAYGLIDWKPEGDAQKHDTQTVVSRGALKDLLTPKDMDAGLAKVRDHALRRALIETWEVFTAAPAEPHGEDGDKRRGKNPAAVFAEYMAREGIRLKGHKVTVRRVRMVEELAVVPIYDRRTALPHEDRSARKPYKAYKPDGNAFGDIYRSPNGRFSAVVISRFSANQSNFDAATHRPHPAAKKLMRLHIDDMVAVDEGGCTRVLRVVKMSGQKVTLADHFEGGALKKRHDDKDDPFRYLEKSAGTLIGMGLRKVGVDEIGRLTDPGPRVMRHDRPGRRDRE
jgi:CRISPR-associated endonuclease Csn1